MKMYLALGLFCCSGLLIASAASKQAMFAKLRSNGFSGYEAAIVVRCVDDEDQAVPDANIRTALYPDRGDNMVVRNGRTGPDGCFQIKGRTSGEVSFTLKKSGYYRTRYDYRLYDDAENDIRDGKWQPYGATNTVVLKRIRNPIAMFVGDHKSHELVFPDKMGSNRFQCGYDMCTGDWVKPVGRGTTTDVLFTLVTEANPVKPDGSKFRQTITLEFTNGLDGALLVKNDMTSEFHSAYRADPAAPYQHKKVFCFDRYNGTPIVDGNLKADEHLVIRVRTRIDGNGHVVQANYGKIYGEMRINGTGLLVLSTYFNPTPNDTNLEFDPDKNLSDDGDWRHKTHFAP